MNRFVAVIPIGTFPIIDWTECNIYLFHDVLVASKIVPCR